MAVKPTTIPGAKDADAAASAEASAPETKEAEAVISAGFSAYIGPNLPGIIQSGTIFPVGRDEALKLPEVELALAKKPGIANLIVDGKTLPEDRIKIKKPGEPLYNAYIALRR